VVVSNVSLSGLVSYRRRRGSGRRGLAWRSDPL